tara:strand:- start:1378 stop:1581 length:204 start_codon:yes stop_codon:yes gene_type:complete
MFMSPSSGTLKSHLTRTVLPVVIIVSEEEENASSRQYKIIIIVVVPRWYFSLLSKISFATSSLIQNQ